MSAAQPPPLSLYVHLPWCLQKCPYCDFNSHTAGDAPPKRRYLAALARDLEREAPRIGRRIVGTIFLGGGTPSLFAAAEIGDLLDAVDRQLRVAGDVEVTMEANPGTLERGRLVDYRRAGVNRLSLGAQSFDAATLERIGRIHGPAEILSAYDDALGAGFESVNLDLMYGLPGQTEALAFADLERAIGLAAPHVSWYQLTLEPNTVFHARPPAGLPDEDRVEAIEQGGRDRLAAAGYTQYETSAFARPGHRCRHNLNYWRFGDYLGIGAGAHGKITDAGGAVRRFVKPLNPRAYMAAMESAAAGRGEARRAPAEPPPIPAPELAFEFMLNALRLTDGFARAEFEQRTGLTLDIVAPGIERAVAAALLEPAGDGWRPTARGRRFQNDLQAIFLPPAAGGEATPAVPPAP